MVLYASLKELKLSKIKIHQSALFDPNFITFKPTSIPIMQSGVPDFAAETRPMAALITERTDEIIATLKNQRQTGMHTDVLIDCNDGQLHAHKCIITGNNNYFSAMFQCNMLEAKTNQITFNNSSAAIDVILSFIYAEPHPPSLMDKPKLQLEVIEIAHMMEMSKLFQFYWRMWTDSLNPSILLDVWTLAVKYDQLATIQCVLNYMWFNLRQIPLNVVVQLTEVQIETFFKKFEGNPPNDDFIDFILRWGSGNLISRKDSVLKLVSSIDLSSLTCAFVASLLEENILDDFSPFLKDRFVKQAIVKLSFAPNFKINISHTVLDDFSGDAKLVVFDTLTNSWSKSDNLRLRQRHCANWQPIISAKGERFYYGISRNQKFVVYDPIAEKHHFGPRSNNMAVSGFVNDTELFFRERNYFYAVFNFATRKWKKLRFNMKDRGQTILVAKGKIYFNSNKKNVVFIYDVIGNSWTEVVKPETEMINVKCACLASSCKGKLYFIKGTKLFVYNVRSGAWWEKDEPLFSERVAIVGNCEVEFILFKEKEGSGLWMFYVSSDRWFKLPCSIIDIWPKSSFHVSYSY
uniref:BTB domain-containing protein n=1 Tax=Strigamia maritima TaxID=126957 RepID=T1IUI8_STRMM